MKDMLNFLLIEKSYLDQLIFSLSIGVFSLKKKKKKKEIN